MTQNCWDIFHAVVAETPRILLHGAPGTGKSYMAARAGVIENRIVYAVTLTEEMPSAELRGHYVPHKQDFIWQDGPAIAAWRNGARLVLNEIDKASGDCLTFLMAILDDPDTTMITLPTGETVRPTNGFTIIATMNGNPGSDLPQPLRDRFPVCIEINEVHPQALAQLPEDLRMVVRNTTLVEDSARRMSIRVWLEFVKLRTMTNNDIASAACFGKRSGDVLAALKIAGVTNPETSKKRK